MIVSFRHKGLQLLYAAGDKRRLPAEYADKIARMLARLDEATAVTDLDLPGFRLHALKGNLTGYWSLSVSGNWRLVFRFDAGNAFDLDLVDYH